MKHKILLLLIVLLILSRENFAQVENRESLVQLYKKLDSVNAETIKTGFFLNKGFLLGQFMDKMRTNTNDKDETRILFMSVIEWNSFYLGLVKSSMGNEKIKIDPQAVIAKYRTGKEKVAIGLAHTEGEWLKPAEIEENVKSVRMGESISKKYETLQWLELPPCLKK